MTTKASLLEDRRAVGYIRVSTLEQSMPDKPSLTQQRERIEASCTSQDWELERVYQDVISGAKSERPGLDQMLRDAEAGSFGRVVFLKTDRLGRNLKDLLTIAERLRDLRIDLVSVTEGFDTRTPVGKMFFQFLGMFAEFERETIKGRTAGGRVGKMQSGSYMPSLVAYGYQVDRETKTLTEHPLHGQVVRDIFQWSTRENMGAPGIAKRLNERSVPPPDNATHETKRSKHGWHQSVINRMLKNARYTGRGSYAGVEVTYPAIVDEVTFAAAQKGFEARKHFRAAHPSKYVYLLQHIVKCRHCGGACSAGTSGRQKLPYYVCNAARRYGSGKHGGKSGWPASKVEPPVQRFVHALLTDPARALAQAELYFKQLDEAHTARAFEAEQAKETLRKLDKDEERADTALRTGRWSEQKYDAQLAQIQAERTEAEARLAQITQADAASVKAVVDRQMVLGAIELMQQSPLLATDIDALGEWMIAGGNAKAWQETIRVLVGTVWLEPNGSVTVEGLLTTPSEFPSMKTEGKVYQLAR